MINVEFSKLSSTDWLSIFGKKMLDGKYRLTVHSLYLLQKLKLARFCRNIRCDKPWITLYSYSWTNTPKFGYLPIVFENVSSFLI